MHNGTGPAFLLFSRRPVALFFGLTAVILGILGMHILGASHHGPASVGTAHAASDVAPMAAGDAHAASLSGVVRAASGTQTAEPGVALGASGTHLAVSVDSASAAGTVHAAASGTARAASAVAHAASLSGPRAGEQAASHGADAVQVLIAHPNEDPASMQGACTEPCSENQAHMGAMCILMIGGLLLLLLIPKELSLRRWDFSRLYGAPFGRTFRLPPALSLHQLCISRT